MHARTPQRGTYRVRNSNHAGGTPPPAGCLRRVSEDPLDHVYVTLRQRKPSKRSSSSKHSKQAWKQGWKQRVEMSRKEVNNEQAQWDREKKHKDALIRSVLVCLCLSEGLRLPFPLARRHSLACSDQAEENE